MSVIQLGRNRHDDAGRVLSIEHADWWRTEFLNAAGHRLLRVDGRHLYIADEAGLWTLLDGRDLPAVGAFRNALELVSDSEPSASVVREYIDRLLSLLGKEDPPIRKCSLVQMNQKPLFRNARGAAIIDMRDPDVRRMNHDEVRNALMLADAVPTVLYNPGILDEPPPAALEAMEHYGIGLFQRIAWLMLQPRKNIDLVRMPTSNAGKSTLALWMSRAFVGGVVTLQANEQLREREFSVLRRSMASCMLTFLDEADKVESDAARGRINQLTDDTVAVNEKFQAERIMPRRGNVVMLGADWPTVTTGQGIETRFGWVWDRATEPMRDGLRDALMHDDCLEFLATWLIETARAAYWDGNDGSTPETNAAAQRAVAETIDPIMRIMGDILVPGVGASPADIKSAFAGHDDAADLGDINRLAASPRWSKAIRNAVPGAERARRDGRMLWLGVGIRDDAGRPSFLGG